MMKFRMNAPTSRALRLVAGAFLVAALGGGRASAADQADLPASFSEERYAGMKTSSPFALATAAVVKEEPNFARDMFLSGRANIGGREMVSITTQDKKTFTLIAGDPPVDGMSLLEVNPSPLVGKTTAVIKKGSDTATLQFNEMAIRAPAVLNVVPGQPRANLPNVNIPTAPRANNSRGTTGRPSRRIIRRPSS